MVLKPDAFGKMDGGVALLEAIGSAKYISEISEKFEILEVSPDAAESENKIVTTYLKVKSKNGRLLTVFIPDWTRYFPYTKPTAFGMGKELINKLQGCQVALEGLTDGVRADLTSRPALLGSEAARKVILEVL